MLFILQLLPFLSKIFYLFCLERVRYVFFENEMNSMNKSIFLY